MQNLVKAKVIKEFTSTALGNLSVGQIIEINPSRLLAWKEAKMVEPVEMKQPEETVVEKVEKAMGKKGKKGK